ncbi:MAG: response regulator [Bacteroidales bacterium]
MNSDQDEFLKELLADFRIEAFEHYQSITNGLITLEKGTVGGEFNLIIEKIFRETHSLKGAARAVNLSDIEQLCMSMESLFNSIKKGEIKLTPAVLDALHSASDTLKLHLDNFDNRTKGGANFNHNLIIKNLESFQRSAIIQKGEKEDVASGESIVTIPIHTAENQDRPIEKENETIRISSRKLIDILNQAEEFITIKSSLEYYKNELFDIYNKVHDNNLYKITDDLGNFQRSVNRMVDDLILDIKSSLLLPFSSLLCIFPKIVRDLSKEYSKEISIDISGDYIEIDRRILEEIKDPLIHLIRNSIDHGIETPQLRRAQGKPSEGKISITVAQEPDRKIIIRIDDDGAGIDKAKVVQSSVKNGIIDADSSKNLTENEIFSLIFNSGVSSKEFVTDISGRGLGMAIVAEKVAKLGGSIEVQSVKKSGTSFIIRLPQTISTLRGILVSVEGQQMIIPSVSLEKVIRIDKNAILTVGSKKAISYSGESIAFLYMSDVLGIESNNNRTDKTAHTFINVLILNNSQKKIAFAVDAIIEEHEGVVKDLGPQLVKIKKISGVTVLGSGRVVPIIEINELFESASKSKSYSGSKDEITSSDSEAVKKRILIAEDSITIRAMLRNFVENAGYLVKTAVDGMEAYKLLMEENFDLVISDIQMPVMNGFELTEKIRELNEHSELPVVLVTALDSADDQRRGMETGANAYIVKGSFEKSNLIETIKRLI